MNKRIIAAVMLLTCLAFMPITSTADYPTGTLGYSDAIAIGEEFEWTVTKLIGTGDFASYTDYVYIGNAVLSQGDKIKVKILEDPDTATGIWYEVYVAGMNITDPYFGYMLLLSTYYSTYFDDFFISPVTYTNTTGTYNIYEQIIEEYEEDNYDYSYSYSETYSGVTVEYEYSTHIEFQLQGDVFSISMYDYFHEDTTGSGYDESVHREVRFESTFNIRTGLIGKSEVYANMEYSMTGVFHLIIDSPYASDNDGKTIVPYTWGFSLLGLLVITAVVALVRRKRQ